MWNTDIPRFIALHFTAPHRYCISIPRQDPPLAQRLQLTTAQMTVSIVKIKVHTFFFLDIMLLQLMDYSIV